MTKKILMCATVDRHFKSFHLPMMEWFNKQGWEVHVAAKGDMDLPFVDRKFNLPIERSPMRLGNVKAYRELKAIIDEQNYNIIHCHTPMGGVLARLAASRARKNGTKVIYTAHGFHFYQGASLANWLLYYPIEKQLARLTDCLITINDEDYGLASRRGFKAGLITHVHGVGVNTAAYRPMPKLDKWRLRLELGYRLEDVLLFYAAEFNANKNQQLLIHALASIKEDRPQVKLLLAGRGLLMEQCQKLAEELGVASMVEFLGYRTDINQLLPMCDVVVASSLREGLPVNIMEAMACGLPIVATRNRGHAELVVDGENGFVVEPNDSATFASRLKQLCESIEYREQMGGRSVQMVQRYGLYPVRQQLVEIYKSYMEQEQDGLERLNWAVQ